jgi:hypothetical protein
MGRGEVHLDRCRKVFISWDASQSSRNLTHSLYHSDFIPAPTFAPTHRIAANYAAPSRAGGYPCSHHTGNLVSGNRYQRTPCVKFF